MPNDNSYHEHLAKNEITNATTFETEKMLHSRREERKSFFEFNLSLKAFVCVENTRPRWVNVIAE